MSNPPSKWYEFGAYRLDPARRLLTRHGEAVTLAPKTFDLLLLLVESQGRALSKKELMDALWPDTFVEEANLTFQISTLRKALGERSWIETVPKHGYRFTGSASPAAARPRRGLLATAVAGVLVVATAAVWWNWGRRAGPIDSLAVLPFVHAGGDPNTEYLSEGISEGLITGLSRVPGLKVKSRDTVFHYKGQDNDVQVVGRELGVRAVLKGRLVQRGDSLSISAELVDTRDGTVLWRDQYHRKVADLLAIEQEISQEIAGQLRLRLTGEERRTRNPEAHRLHLRGRYYWNRGTEEALQKSVECFQQAIERDAGYAQAWAGLADSFSRLGQYSSMPPADAFARARAAATRAIQLEETLAEAHSALAWTKGLEWDWPGADREYRRAIELNPESGPAHQGHAFHLMTMRRLPEALAEIRRAQEAEPLSPVINADVGFLYYYARRYEEAVEEARKAVGIDPASGRPHLVLGLAYTVQRRQREAMAAWQQFLKLSRSPIGLAYAGSGYALLGQNKEAQELLQELLEVSRKRYVSPQLPGMIYANLGEKDRTFEYFESALQKRSLLAIVLRNPLLDSIRSDPRFQSLLRRMGLPP